MKFWICYFECTKQSYVWISTVTSALRQLQTIATSPYIIATTAETKTWPQFKNTLKVCCNAYCEICLRFAWSGDLRYVREKHFESIKAYISNALTNNVRRYYNQSAFAEIQKLPSLYRMQKQNTTVFSSLFGRNESGNRQFCVKFSYVLKSIQGYSRALGSESMSSTKIERQRRRKSWWSIQKKSSRFKPFQKVNMLDKCLLTRTLIYVPFGHIFIALTRGHHFQSEHFTTTPSYIFHMQSSNI